MIKAFLLGVTFGLVVSTVVYFSYLKQPSAIVEKQVEKEKKKEVVQTRTITTIEQKPDGTAKTVTVVDSVSTINTDRKETNHKDIKASTRHLNVSLLAVYDWTDLQVSPKVGVAISREVLGPVTIGIFVVPELRQGGVSAGWSF